MDFVSLTNFSLNELDVFEKLNTNEFYLTVYFYWWSTLWWSPMFELIIGVLLLLYGEFFLVNIYYLVYWCLCWGLLPVFKLYWLLSTDTFLLNDFSLDFNTLLLNPLNQYHPTLFLGLLTFLYSLVFILPLMLNSRCVDYFYINWMLLIGWFVLRFFTLTCFTLVLGSWWALQEGSWGGWWNWDISEYFSLVILLVYIYLLHIINYRGLLGWLYLCLLTLLSINLITQCSLKFTTHLFSEDLLDDELVDKLIYMPLWGILGFLLWLSYFRIVWVRSYTYNTVLLGPLTGVKKLRSGFSVSIFILTILLVYNFFDTVLKTLALTFTSLGFINELFVFIIYNSQVLTLYTLLLVFMWGWAPPLTLLIVLTVFTPLLSLKLTLYYYYSIFTRTWEHLIFLLCFSIVLFTTCFSVLFLVSTGNTLYILPLSLELGLQLTPNIILNSDFTNISFSSVRNSEVLPLVLNWLEFMLGGVDSYHFLLRSSLNEQQTFVTGFYNLWFGSELEAGSLFLFSLLALLLATLSLCFSYGVPLLL